MRESTVRFVQRDVRQISDVRVVVWGLGAMGSGMARLLLRKKGAKVVGGIASRQAKDGKDLGECLGLSEKLGIPVTCDPASVLGGGQADVVVISTSSFVSTCLPQIERAIEAGCDVVTVAEEMSYPWYTSPELADRIDTMARQRGVTVLGTGINPGFVLDTLIIALTGVCEDITSIRARRVNDLSCYGPTVMKAQGVGTTVEEFERGLSTGDIVGHVGFLQSIYMIADAIGWRLDEVRETREPIVSKTRRTTRYVSVEPGMVAGCNHCAYGVAGGRAVITLEHPQQVHPGLEEIETGDYVWIKGTPDISMANRPEIPGGAGTVAIAVNMIPQVVNAAPGLVTMADLPIPAAWLAGASRAGRA